jgi:hypothetical protein
VDAAEAQRWAASMEFFFSGEIDILVGDLWRPIELSMQQRLTTALGARDYGPALRKIAQFR